MSSTPHPKTLTNTVMFLHKQDGDTETGLWCETCLLPSKVKIWLSAITETGVTPNAATMTRCLEGGSKCVHLRQPQ